MQAPVFQIAVAIALVAGPVSADDNWPQFRGHHALGLSSGNPPLQWNVETGENVEWKSAIPGLGHASPIVWGDGPQWVQHLQRVEPE